MAALQARIWHSLHAKEALKMMNFMRDGGFNMWVLLIVGVGTAALALSRTRERRRGVLIAGAFVALCSTLFGLATCHFAVAGYFAANPQATVQDLAVGLRESANNAILGPAIALALGAGAVHATTRTLGP
jgi:hypothetical protein